MSGENIRIFYDGKGNATTVQMPMADFEKVVQGAKEAVEVLSSFDFGRRVCGFPGGALR